MTLEFYEKPGCGGNARQKEKLQSLGCMLVVKSILSTNWDAPTLRSFFGDKPKDEWFNMGAPSIKDGLINPLLLNEEQSIEAMLKEPILIKRPLIKKGEIKISGFDPIEIEQKLGLIINEAPAVCLPSDPCKNNA